MSVLNEIPEEDTRFDTVKKRVGVLSLQGITTVASTYYKKKAVVTNWPQVYLGIPSANILLSVWEIKGASVPLFSYGTGKP